MKPAKINRKNAPSLCDEGGKVDIERELQALSNARFGKYGEPFETIRRAIVFARIYQTAEFWCSEPDVEDFPESPKMEPFLALVNRALKEGDGKFFREVAEAIDVFDRCLENGEVDFIGGRMIDCYLSESRRRKRNPTFKEWKYEFESWDNTHGFSDPGLRAQATKLGLIFSEDSLLTRKEVCFLRRIVPSTLWRWERLGLHFRAGRIYQRDLDQWLSDRGKRGVASA